jgi:hypothetical protein
VAKTELCQGKIIVNTIIRCIQLNRPTEEPYCMFRVVAKQSRIAEIIVEVGLGRTIEQGVAVGLFGLLAVLERVI